jgi:hypothetical protein
MTQRLGLSSGSSAATGQESHWPARAGDAYYGFVPQRLLCLVDLSQISATVLSWTRLLAESYHAQVEVFYALWAPNIKNCLQPRALPYVIFGS